MIPIGEWSRTRLKNLSLVDQSRNESKTNSGFGKNISNWLKRDHVYPTNVLHLATECSYKDHSAPFPLELPEWFIKLFTKEGDIILDPFIGSGTSAIAAARLGRKYLGIDILENYCQIAKNKLDKIPDNIFNINYKIAKNE